MDLCDAGPDSAGASVADSVLVVLCVPVGAMGAAAATIADALPAGAIVSDVGSCKEAVATALREALPEAVIVPAHPVAGTEQSGPESGIASLFHGRWCILTPPEGTDPAAVDRPADFWRPRGAEIEQMAPDHHDRVLAITSHLPHLIAYTLVGTASDPEEVTQRDRKSTRLN